MEPEKLKKDLPTEDSPQLINITKNDNSNKIVIENETNLFEKPEEIKNLPQEINSSTINQNCIPTPPNQTQNIPDKNDNIGIGSQQDINDNISQKINISAPNNANTNLSININTDPSYNASISNDISSYTPSKSKNLGKKSRREYQCEEVGCYKILHDKCAYRKHLLTHGEKLYTCEICNKKFLDNSKLRRHSLVHSGEKPFACPICPKKFSLDFNLRTHMRIHSGEKPYACIFPGCFKRFSQSSNLSAHEKTHELMKKEGGNEEINNKPIFSENPLKYIIENPYSGTETINNINKINEIYEMMKKGILAQTSSFNQNNGNHGVGRNHGEIPGMPIQKRTYIKKVYKENNNLNINYNNMENNNYFSNYNNYYNNNAFNYINNNSYYNNNFTSNQTNNQNLNFNNNIYNNQNIFNNNMIKQNKKLLFQIKEGINNIDRNESIQNNIIEKNIQSEQNNKKQVKRQIFMTYRDPINPNKNNNLINNFNNNMNYINAQNNINYNNENEDENQINKEVEYNEDEDEKHEQENYDIEDNKDDKEFEAFRKFI